MSALTYSCVLCVLILPSTAKAQLLDVLRTGVTTGVIEIEDDDGTFVFGEKSPGGRVVRLRILHRNFWTRVFFSHDLGGRFPWAAPIYATTGNGPSLCSQIIRTTPMLLNRFIVVLVFPRFFRLFMWSICSRTLFVSARPPMAY